MSEFSFDELKSALSGMAAGFRSITRLQPIGGPGSKIFPATYSGGVYATEKRRITEPAGEERVVDCILIDSVQSQSNRAEEALKHAIDRGRLSLPLIEVDFSSVNEKFRSPIPSLTTLDVPHRLADAILRDSELADGTRFSKSDYAKRWSRANVWNATPVYELCPTALVFGMWGSPEKPGGLGAKFERAYVSEIVAVDIEKVERRQGFRIDPIGSSKNVPLKEKADGTYEVGNGKLRPSELNHGNIPFESGNGGIVCRYTEQTTVVSFGALRKLRFTSDRSQSPEINDAGRAVLAALALCAGVLASEVNTSLRSGCQLVPTADREWELLEVPGQTPRTFRLNSERVLKVMKEAVQHAESLGLHWMKEKLALRPSKELAELVRQSQEAAAKEKGDGEAV
ncbi:MAG: type I-U CRISPR-associated protein Cas7 [Acidobacteriaceae bacterium]|nr:type I-U CRISPR-associated protein Cas7 [Acidobacteriaceae bacterium]MBV9499282.1 type I-U CRISPR-associated protein Cas7 [Acidobacteriaceae bacterium]